MLGNKFLKKDLKDIYTRYAYNPRALEISLEIYSLSS